MLAKILGWLLEEMAVIIEAMDGNQNGFGRI
jgi:hypothetical protein